MELKNVIDIALTAGEILLANGAETYRIEDTVVKICEAYGFTGECLSMSNGLLLSVEQSGVDKVTSMKKVNKKHVDLYRIELINSFSRQICEKSLSYEEAKKILDDIKKAPKFTLSVRIMAACMTGFIYTLFFNGSLLDGISSIIICLITYVILEKISELGFFQFLEFYLSGLLIGGGSILSEMLISSINKHNVITGAIMILLPGVVLTNGIKDILYGDFSSGVAKFFEAMIVIIAVSAGIGTSLIIYLKGM
ncbi:threonine/serine ThrE exporter family protein [Clostridium weizhouense]|uniref:Threonine/serine exporter family protein n=1 Tax=Clostridium weizhouense TaxID=2859781 RepID=A0ABS7AL92_9CLOT|nr:threonine/serine exporter family protein [Clostridium weizhouense]MBW6409435.1 threonine/serine exporter family protein [Clostridium weizhouense]